jgi:hypothetical protein
MRCGQPRYGYSEWGAADIIQTDFLKEKDGLRVASMFTADTYLEILVGGSPSARGYFYKLTDALYV